MEYVNIVIWQRRIQVIKLYTTHCPQCRVLEGKLNAANIQYEECTDQDEMINRGFKSVPMLEVNGEVMPFAAAIKWVNNR